MTQPYGNYQYEIYFAVRSKVDGDIDADPRATVLYWASVFGKSLTWPDLTWLRSLTKLPLIPKGICHPDDARRAIDYRVDGRLPSRLTAHGSRLAARREHVFVDEATRDAGADVPQLLDLSRREQVDNECARGSHVSRRGVDDLLIAVVGELGFGESAVVGVWSAGYPAPILEPRDHVRQPGHRTVRHPGQRFHPDRVRRLLRQGGEDEVLVEPQLRVLSELGVEFGGQDEQDRHQRHPRHLLPIVEPGWVVTVGHGVRVKPMS